MEKYTYIRKTITWENRRYEVRGKTEQEACDKLAELVASLKPGRICHQRKHHGGPMVSPMEGDIQSPFRPHPKESLGLYDEKYNGYIGPAIGTLKLKDVRDLHLQTILNTQAGMSYSHVSKLRMVMQELFRQARRSRLIIYDPAEGLLLPESVKRSHRPITKAERRHILAVAQTHPAGLWVLTILYTGLRPGETAALFWEDIDFDRNEIHVYKAVESGTRTIKAPKTPAGIRDIPMRQELRERLLAVRGEGAAPVFPSANGGIRSANSLRRLWNSFAHALTFTWARKSGTPNSPTCHCPGSDALLSPAYLLHRPSARRSPNQRGQRIDGACEYLCHSERGLVLCVAVMLSVMVMGAGAAFSDQDKIENTEAVDACSALNIIGGYPDGSYKPEGNIKRSEICKMICVALNGGEEPTLGTPATPHVLRRAQHPPNAAWAEKYIESCVSQGIVSGVGGGRFSPNGNVTGSQLAKMLLVCLGFDSDIEGYTGNAWDMNVNVRATQKGLYKGLEGLDVSAALTRDTAAQMVWNALQAGEVKYEYTWVGGDATKVTAVDKLDNANNPITLLKDKYNAEVKDGGIVTSVKEDSKGTYTVKTDKNANGYTKVAKDYSDLMGQKVDVLVKISDNTVYGVYANEDSKVLATGAVGQLDTVSNDTKKMKLNGVEYKFEKNGVE